MSTPSYLIAHRAVPMHAASRPEELWRELSGPGWSMWLALIGMDLQIEVRNTGIKNMHRDPVTRSDGIEMLAMYFPEPQESGEPYFAVLARRAGETALRSFVFERGMTTTEEPVRVVMAEWTFRGPDNIQRMRFDTTADPSLDACIARTVAVMNERAGERRA